MKKLNQIIAIEKGVKAESYSRISELHKLVQKSDLFNGFTRQYSKKDEDGEDLSGENKEVQQTVPDILREASDCWREFLTVAFDKDTANLKAVVDVRVSGEVVVSRAPVTFLLTLEKQLNDIKTFIEALPELDSAERWDRTANNDTLYQTPVIVTNRTKKVPKPIVLYPATAEHPAQTQLTAEDVVVGSWLTTKLSGALSRRDKRRLLERVAILQKSVKEAREEANSIEVGPSPIMGAAIVSMLFGDFLA